MRRRTGSMTALTLAPVVVLLAAGCGFTGSDASGDARGTISVVASTDVWGDVVRQVAGDLTDSTVRITSIIGDPDADPHSYEADPQNQLALARADLVVENGGGYDDFVRTMMSSARGSGGSDPTVLDAVRISGHTAAPGGELNEHVWYDFPTVARVAAEVAAFLAKADPADAGTFRANAAGFSDELTALEATEASIRAAHAGEGVAVTEPVPVYLLDACGLVDRTPAAFSEAIEEGGDVSVGVLHQTLSLFNDHEVALLAYNEQTSGPETEAVLGAARRADVAVVPVTETLPAHEDYLTWMRDNLAAVQTALG